MISLVQPLHIGNAIRLHFAPPVGARFWRVLRKETDDIVGYDDPSAFLVYEGSEDAAIDSMLLRNGIRQFYQPFWTADGVTWQAGPVATATPAADYAEYTTDVLSFLRERLEAGLLVEVERGSFQTELGYIQVLMGSPSLERDLRFPLVTLHVESETSGERALGEDISGDEFDAIGFDWDESEGWWGDHTITVIGWSLNGDERNELRKALRRIVIGNMPVFEAQGWTRIDFRAEDIDAVNGEYPSPMYQVMGTFSCIAPVRVGGKVDAISTVISRSLNA